MLTIVSNFRGNLKRVTANGREFLVAPLTMIVTGVLNGSKGALYYPADEISRNVDAWNGMPLVVNHPTDDEGRPISARTPEAWTKYGIGHVHNSAFRRGKLVAEGWFDVDLTQRVDARVLNRLLAGDRIELSTGLFTQDFPAPPGATYNGKRFDFIARNYRPDHLAILPDVPGACSLRDGCGVNVVNANPEGCNQFKKCGGGAAGAMDGKAKRVVKAVKKKVVEKYKALVGRYGKVGAAAVLAGWMAPMPGAGPIATGIAEAVRFLGKRVKRSTTTNAAFFAALNLSLDDMVADAVSFFQELYAEFGESAPEIDQDTIRSTIQNELIRDSMTDNISQMSATVSKLIDAEPLKSKMLDDGFHHHFISSDPETAARKTAKKFSGAKVEGERGLWSVMVMMGEEEHMFHFLRPESVINHTKIHENLNVKTNANPAQNSKGDSEMKLTQAQRSEIVSHLTANCDCWKGKDDAKVLNAFPDDKLVALKKHADEEAEKTAVVNAARQGFTINGVTFVVNGDGKMCAKKGDKEVPVENEKECAEMMESQPPAKKKEPTMNDGAKKDGDAATTNSGQIDVAGEVRKYLSSLTPQQHLALLPQEVQSAVTNAVSIEKAEREKLTAQVKQLVANESNPQRKAVLESKLAGTPTLNTLREVILLATPVANAAPAGNPNDMVSFFGVGGVSPAPTTNKDDDLTANAGGLPLPGDLGYLDDAYGRN